MNFIRLTLPAHYSGSTQTFVRSDCFVQIRSNMPNIAETTVYTSDGQTINVVETPNQILELINESK